MPEEIKDQLAIREFDIILIALLCESIRSDSDQFYTNGKLEWISLKEELDRLRSELQASIRSSRPPLPKGTTLYDKS